MRFFKATLIVFLFAGNVSLAQQNLVYNLYSMNPYLYNPSYIAPRGHTELFMNYRKQWAQFSGAPTTTTLNLQVPINYRMGFGVNLYNDQAGILQTNTGVISFAYQIYLGKSTKDLHRLGFGLAAGVTMNRINLNKVDDPNDPSIVNNNSSNMDGQFGINYQFNNLKIGFSLPRLFLSRLISEGGFSTPKLDQLNYTITTVSYNFVLGPRLALEPYFLYRTSEIVDPQFEIMGVLKMDDLLWGGASYRQNYGAIAFLGFNLKEKFRVGYAYEFAPSQVTGFGNGTHEVQVSVRLGKKKRSERPVAQSEAPIQPVVIAKQPNVEEPKPVVEEKKEEPIKEEKKEEPIIITEQKPIVVEPAAEQPKEKLITLSGRGLKPGYYVVVGAFRSNRNALAYMNNLNKEGYPATVSFSPAKEYYYVHMGNHSSHEEAAKLRDDYRKENKFTLKDTWILTVEE
ncbi:MAG: PorP/SprF family type IX secretion system membrane protein [Cyclobacteriaceae bacterium]|nr:PorP/SprF family type IX secretion system membrane protein [Cyclobacteriaceae bacterium]